MEKKPDVVYLVRLLEMRRFILSDCICEQHWTLKQGTTIVPSKTIIQRSKRGTPMQMMQQ